jgi:L-asparaginase II
MSDFSVVETRGGYDETRHRVHVAVVHASGRAVAHAGDIDGLTFWRSAAKPFQLWPLVAGGGVSRFQLDPRHLAIACASHSATTEQRAVVAELLDRVGVTEADLACGGHLSLSRRVAHEMIKADIRPTPIWSNCSGKHAGLLALARLHDWPIAGYTGLDHPVHAAVTQSIAHWTGMAVERLGWGVDGCSAAAVATPLTALAFAWARLGTADESALARIRAAMMAHPELIASDDRLDTILMRAWPERIVVKIGAGGVYAAALPGLGLGVALKVEDGDMATAGVALVNLLVQLTGHVAPGEGWPLDRLMEWRAPEIRNTRGDVVGTIQLRGTLVFP